MKQAHRRQGLRAFSLAATTTTVLLLLAIGLLTADFNSRRMQDGAGAVPEYGRLAALLAFDGREQAVAQTLWHAVPARWRVLAKMQDEEQRLANRVTVEGLLPADAAPADTEAP